MPATAASCHSRSVLRAIPEGGSNATRTAGRGRRCSRSVKAQQGHEIIMFTAAARCTAPWKRRGEPTMKDKKL